MRIVQRDIKKVNGARVLVVKVIDSDKKIIDSQVIKSAVEGHLETIGDPEAAESLGVANEGGLDQIALSANPVAFGAKVGEDLKLASDTNETFHVEVKNVKTREYVDSDKNEVIERSIDVRIPQGSNENDDGDQDQDELKKQRVLQRNKQPPKSMFQHLLPSKDRYTFSKDEL